jgi:hypothetical protein
MQNIIEKNTSAWKFQTWASFVLSFGLTLIGVFMIPGEFWIKGYLAMGIIFTVGSCFTLAKTIRDDHEVEKLSNRVYNAKTEKVLKEYEE